MSTVVENRLILEGIQGTASDYQPFTNPRVEVFDGNHRAFLQQRSIDFDVVFYPLTEPYQPVTNGVYSIKENYMLTVEGATSALSNLSPGGVLVSSRWLQSPPSEGIRLVSILLSSLDNLDIQDAPEKFVIYRGIQTLTVLVKEVTPIHWQRQ